MMSRRNPRSDVLIASKHRSGSLHESEEIGSPTEPLSPNSVDENSPPAFPAAYSADSLTRSNKVGSKVSRIKEMFQTTNGTEHNKFQPIKPQHTSFHYSTHIISPPPTSKRKLPRDPTSPSPTASMVREPTSPTTAGTNAKSLQEPSNHVQRFNYTRALFARMEEETKAQQERERLRRPSPVSGATSPVLSPDRLTARSPDGMKRAPSEDARHPEAHKKYRSATDLKDPGEAAVTSSTTSRRSRADQRPPIPVRKPDLRPAYSEPSIPKSVITSASSTPGGLLWKRKQNEDILSEISNLDKYSAAKNRTNLSQSSSKLEERMDVENNNQNLDNSVFSQPDLHAPNGSVTEDLSITSAYQPRKSYLLAGNSGFDKNMSSSVEALSNRSRSSSNEYPRSQSERSRPNGHEEGQKPVVSYRQKAPSKIITSAPGKRLSKEEIQAALDRADTYLQRTSGSSDDTDSKPKPLSPDSGMSSSDITQNATEQIEPVSEPLMSKSDSNVQSTEPQSQLRSWARYRNQRYSRTSDYLDDKVGDISKLGSISDISVSGFRKASVENLASKSPERSKSPETNHADNANQKLMSQTGATRTSETSDISIQSDKTPSDTIESDRVIVSETSVNLKAEIVGGVDIIPNEQEASKTDIFDRISHSTTMGPPLPQRPIPIPRRTAPSPPMDTPPPPPPKQRGLPPKYRPPMPTEPPPPVPCLGPSEESEPVQTVLPSDIKIASVLPSDVDLPPVPMRQKGPVVMLGSSDEVGETSDSEEPEPLQRTG